MRSSIRPANQAARVAACLALLNFAVPGGAIVSLGVPLKEGVQKALAARAAAARGRTPTLAGGQKWDVVYKGIDVMTGNYSTSATDLSFDGGYGIPVNVTRSYSANQADEGPFGKGWTLSADVRTTAGGLLKGGSAPVRSVPPSSRSAPTRRPTPICR